MAEAGEWVLLLYRLPRQPSTPRRAVRRRLKRPAVAWGQEQELASALSAARIQEYLAVRDQAQALSDAAPPQERVVRTARRLRAEPRRIRRRECFPPAERDAAAAACVLAGSPGRPVRWATRPAVHIARAACAWLLRRSFDPDAVFVLVADPDQVPEDATAFDIPGVELCHHGTDCTFETLLRRYNLTDPVLWRLAALVHEADRHDGRFDAHEAPGSDLPLRGRSTVEPDRRVLELIRPLFDGTYECCRRQLLLGREPA